MQGYSPKGSARTGRTWLSWIQERKINLEVRATFRKATEGQWTAKALRIGIFGDYGNDRQCFMALNQWRRCPEFQLHFIVGNFHKRRWVSPSGGYEFPHQNSVSNSWEYCVRREKWPKTQGGKGGRQPHSVSEELRVPSKDTYCDTVRGSHVLNVEAWRVVVRHPGAGQWGWRCETNRMTRVRKTWNTNKGNEVQHYL